MRTSRISQETTRIFNALSPNARKTRSTRSSAKGIATFALGYDGSVEVKQDASVGDLTETPPSEVEDIEDIAQTPTAASRKRKRGPPLSSPATKVLSSTTTIEEKSNWISPRKRQQIKQEEDSNEDAVDDEDIQSAQPSPAQGRVKAKPKIPARRVTQADGTVLVQPPSNWEEVYSIIKDMRERNPTAPVDTMGCEDLSWHSAPPREKRYHTLTALMLSSQTKDTVTAAAMQRLHTELVPSKTRDADGKMQQSSLTVGNILACSPTHLDNLIGKVGFHNNKTKYIKAAAQLLKDEYGGDIPNSIEGLMRLPGVGPKMAYLCMSAAWGVDEGIGVDVHVHRITNLWGWHVTKSPEETRTWLESWLPRDCWHHINKMLVGLGQTVCLPVGRRCGECALAGKGLCKAEIKGWKATERKIKKEKIEVEQKDDKVAEMGGDTEVLKVERTEVVDTNVKEQLAG